MSRVVNTDSHGKRRNQNMRSGAELLRHLIQKPQIDAEARDMLAALVYVLRDLDTGIDESVVAWEKRDYWIKAEQFRERWAWVGMYADSLNGLVREQAWNDIPGELVKLMPYFTEITITKFTRSSKLWEGMYARLQQEEGA